jgi:8-oxo-dGTP pyrophosphatase MutT (NUDIX family)
LTTVYDDQVVFPGGNEGRYLRIVESDGRPGVAMLAICGTQVALVRIFRYPLASWEWAIPRGYSHDDDASGSARAELAEELGQEPDQLTSLGTVTPNSGMLTSRVELFLANYTTATGKPMDQKEVAAIKWIDMKILYDEIANGEIQDAFTLSALTCAQARGLIVHPQH